MVTQRALTFDDPPALTRVYGGASVRYTTGRALSLDQAQEKIRSALVRAAETAQWSWGTLAADEMIGLIALRRRSPLMATTSYILREDTWGKRLRHRRRPAGRRLRLHHRRPGPGGSHAPPRQPGLRPCPGQGWLLPQRYHRPACRRWGRRAVRDVGNPKQGALRRRSGVHREGPVRVRGWRRCQDGLPRLGRVIGGRRCRGRGRRASRRRPRG
ncbi:acetyltransferase [Streptomyces sp. C]|nr:acetyltransferase [Streptomyces sp. C]